MDNKKNANDNNCEACAGAVVWQQKATMQLNAAAPPLPLSTTAQRLHRGCNAAGKKERDVVECHCRLPIYCH